MRTETTTRTEHPRLAGVIRSMTRKSGTYDLWVYDGEAVVAKGVHADAAVAGGAHGGLIGGLIVGMIAKRMARKIYARNSVMSPTELAAAHKRHRLITGAEVTAVELKGSRWSTKLRITLCDGTLLKFSWPPHANRVEEAVMLLRHAFGGKVTVV